jgi:hypothetical protein
VRKVIQEEDSPYPKVYRPADTDFVTIGEAKQEYNRIESLYRENTE